MYFILRAIFRKVVFVVDRIVVRIAFTTTFWSHRLYASFHISTLFSLIFLSIIAAENAEIMWTDVESTV